MLLSGNVQSEHVAAGESDQSNDNKGILTLQDSVCQCYFQVTSNLNMSQQGKGFKQRYYRKLKTLNLCRPVLLSGNVQSEHVAAGKVFKRAILSEP